MDINNLIPSPKDLEGSDEWMFLGYPVSAKRHGNAWRVIAKPNIPGLTLPIVKKMLSKPLKNKGWKANSIKVNSGIIYAEITQV